MSQPPRFAIERASIEISFARVTGAELHHLRDVRRLGPGDEVELIDEASRVYAGRIEHIDRDCAVIALAQRSPSASRIELILAAGLIRGPRMDFLVEKAAELGAVQLIPLLTKRSAPRQAGAQRLQRWRRIATAAAKQSLAPRLMTIHGPLAISQLVSYLPQDTLALICMMDAPLLSAILRDTSPPRVLLVCGPEGGFDPGEIKSMLDAGFRPAALGPTRLRSETEAMAALSIAESAILEIARRS
jgi:16S rRNA (uracil1498-N3)-methyltransferase